MLGSCNIWARDFLNPSTKRAANWSWWSKVPRWCTRARKTRSWTPSTKGSSRKSKWSLEGPAPPASSSTAAPPRCGGSSSSRARWKASSSSSWSNWASISRQKRSSLSSFMVSSSCSCFFVSNVEPGGWGHYFYNPQEKNMTSKPVCFFIGRYPDGMSVEASSFDLCCSFVDPLGSGKARFLVGYVLGSGLGCTQV